VYIYVCGGHREGVCDIKVGPHLPFLHLRPTPQIMLETIE